jgi:glycerophosphoryl diester phosphodiesterase
MKNSTVLPLLIGRITIILMAAWFFSLEVQSQCNRLHIFNIRNTRQLQDFFKYTPDMIPFVSAHRGGAAKGFPENCIPTFENTLCHVHAILEIDTRLTSDGEIVLMHDVTIDRTTTGKGRVSDYTLKELGQFYLTDTEGNPTEYKIPTLDEVLKWVDGKTMLVLDRKTVPIETLVNKVIEHKMLHRVIFMVYNYDEAQLVNKLQPEAVMEVFVKDKNALDNLMATGIPPRNMVAFIAHARPEDNAIYSQINQAGMMNIIGTGRIFDHDFKKGQTRIYEDLIEEGCNIIEADLAIDAGLRIKRFRPAKSSKDRYFGRMKD